MVGETSSGISPLIAAVLMIAFTLSLAGIFGQWIPEIISDVQTDTSEDAVELSRSSNLDLKIRSTEFDRASNNLEVQVQNTGDSIGNRTNISLTALGDHPKAGRFDADLSTGEITRLKLDTQRTSGIKGLRVSLTDYPVSDEVEVKCLPTRGLVGYWTFNEEQTVSDQAVDISGFDNEGVLGGDVSSIGAPVGEGYKLDGDGDFVEISDSSSLDIESDITVAMWYRSRQDTMNDYSYIMQKGSFAGGSYFWTDSGNDGYRVAPRIVDTDGDWYGLFQFEPRAKYGEWEHLTYTYDSDSGYLRGYSGSKKIIQNQPGAHKLQQTDNNIYLGRGGPGGNINGSVDEFRLYNRSLSKEEVTRLNEVRDESWALDACKIVEG